MNHTDKELLEEAYGKILDEGVFDRIGARGSSLGSKWASKVAGGVGKAINSDVLKKASQDLGSEATTKELRFLTNKIVKKFIKNLQNELEDMLQAVDKTHNDMSALHSELSSDAQKLNLDDSSPELQQVNNLFFEYETVLSDIKDAISAKLKDSQSYELQAFGRKRDELGRMTKELNPNLKLDKSPSAPAKNEPTEY